LAQNVQNIKSQNPAKPLAKGHPTSARLPTTSGVLCVCYRANPVDGRLIASPIRGAKKRPAIGIRRKSERLPFCVVIPFARVVYVCFVSSVPKRTVGIVCVSGVVENAAEI
jgi:hypothetical protein